jgi:predicted N-acyltransferase
VPVYLKETSFGDFSSDWHWARAYQDQGHSFYPKLVVASPFTPATGPKILAAENGLDGARRVEVFELMREEVGRLGASALQFLFAPPEGLGDLPLIERHGCQFHWHNPGYRDFADFLDQLTSRRRKEILRERRQVREAGIELVVRPGGRVTEAEWALFHQLYVRTFEHYGNYPALTEGFFRTLGETMGDQVSLVTALRGEQLVAAAFFLLGESVLYGRYWGTLEALPALHFEACYYQGIELAITQGLSTFEPGAQGEHKISRGFLPQRTLSYHWIRHPGFRAAIARHVASENIAMAQYMSACLARSPYREERC